MPVAVPHPGCGIPLQAELDEHYIIRALLIGQSNELCQIGGAGSATGPIKSRIPMRNSIAGLDAPLVRAYRDTTITSDEVQTWHATYARQPVAGWNWGGYDIVLATRMTKVYRRAIEFIEVAKGATTLAVDWLAPSGAMYTRCVASANTAISTHPDPPAGARIRPWIVVIHGESDSANSTYANNYGANLSTLIAGLRADVTDFDSAQVLIVKLHPNCAISGSTPTTVATVRAAQQAYCDNPANNAYAVESSTIEHHVDLVHYTEAGHITMGNLVTDEMFLRTAA